MNLEMLILALVPPVLFVFVEMKAGQKAGIITALVAAIVLFVYWYIRTGTIDETLLVEAGLMLLLGGLSLKLKDSRFFKFQPTIVAVIFFAYFAFFQIQGDPVLGRLMRMMEPIAGEQLTQIMRLPNYESCISSSSLWTMFALLGHGLLVAWGAIKLGSIGWLMTRLALYPILIAVSLTMRFCLSAF